MNLAHFVPRAQISGSDAVKTDGTLGALSDTLDLRTPAVGVHALASGTLRIRDERGNTADLNAIEGSDYPRSICRVLATGSTLTDAQFVLLFPLWGPAARGAVTGR